MSAAAARPAATEPQEPPMSPRSERYVRHLARSIGPSALRRLAAATPTLRPAASWAGVDAVATPALTAALRQRCGRADGPTAFAVLRDVQWIHPAHLRPDPSTALVLAAPR